MEEISKMKWREPLYLGEEAAEHADEYISMTERLGETPDEDLGFYLIIRAANEQNLMELVPALSLKQTAYRMEDLYIAGMAEDKDEAYELCQRIVEDCRTPDGKITTDCLFPETKE